MSEYRFDGNAQSVALLERLLEHARKGMTRYVGVLMCDEPNRIHLETAGASDMEDQIPDVLDRFKAAIVPRVSNRNDPPPRDESLGANYVCYNVAAMPVSYDFVPWLIKQEMRRRRENAPSPLRVGFYFGKDGQSGIDSDYRATMFEHVVLPMLSMIGAVEDPKAIGGIYDQEDGFEPYMELVLAARSGLQIARITPPAEHMIAVRETLGHYVTITLREADYWRPRNSNKPAWIAFAKDLKRQGRRVIFVRDTARANETIEGFETCPPASVSLTVRTALYEGADVNFFVSNGPCTIASHGSVPYLLFIPIDDDAPFVAGTTRWWKAALDMDVGDQYPWALPGQRIVWSLDTYEAISDSWRDLQNELQQAA